MAARVQKVLAEILQAPEIRKKFEESGATVRASNINAAGFIAEESAKVKRIVDFAKISEE